MNTLRSESTLSRLAAGCASVLLAASAGHAQLPAGASRLHVSGVECRNLSAGSTVRSTAPATEWDCVDLGLAIQAGDLVAISVRGRVPIEPTSLSPHFGPGSSSVAPLLVESEISGRGANRADAADFDLDGDQDLVLDDEFRWLEFVTDDPPTFIDHDLVGRSPLALDVVALDVNGDGRPDIASSFGVGADLITWHQNVPGDPPVFLERTVYNEPGWRPWYLGSGDFDGDGDDDIISWNNQLQGGTLERLVWHENDGSGGFTSQEIYEIDCPSFLSIAFEPGDLDGDGDLDFFVRDTAMRWLENDGAPQPSWQAHLVDGDFIGPGVGLADFDRDGDLDAVAGFDFTFQSALIGGFLELRLYENSDGQFDQIQIHTIGLFDTGSVPVIADLNADGWPDLFLPESNLSSLGFRWMENQGSLNFVEHLALNVDGLVPKFVPLAVDLGGDGDLDVVGPRDDDPDGSIVRAEAQMTVGGWSSGLTADRIRCRNLRTGQSVSNSAPTGPAFDCEAMGLNVSPGDQVQATIRGVAE